MAKGKDVEGSRGGDTGETKDVGKGAKAEKGDAHREGRQHEGKTRPHASRESGHRSGSDSNAGSENE